MHSRCTALRTVVTRVTPGSNVVPHKTLTLHLCTPCPMLWRTPHWALALRPLLFWFLDLQSIAKIHYLLKVALLRNYHLLQVMSLTRSSTTRLLITRRTCTSQKMIRSLNLRTVSNPCPTTSRFYLQPITRRRGSRRHRNRTSMTNNFVLCWLHHFTYRSEEHVQNDHKFITLNEKAWCPVHLKIRQPEEQGNLSIQETAVFSSQSRLNIDTFSDRDQFSSKHQQVFFGSNEPFSDSPTPQMYQEHKVESLDRCIDEFQQQTYAQRLELQDVYHGYVESPREQGRLQEE